MDRIDSPIGISNHSVVFRDVVLEQPIPHLVYRQEIYLTISVNWKLVNRDMKDLKWNEIIRSPFPVSSLSEALLLFIRDRVPQ